MFKNHKYYVGHHSDDLVFGYTKRTNGISNYPSESFNMALYIGDDPTNVHYHQSLLSEEIGFDRESFVMPVQGHDNNVYEVTKDDCGTNIDILTDNIHNIDALYTYDRDVLLAMNYADCTPIYIYSVENSFIGLVHAGWKGTKKEVLKKLLDHYDGDLDDLRVVIGVTINGDYYEVDDNVINDTFKVQDNAVKRISEGKYLLNLKEVNKTKALEYGIKEEHIYVTPLGTESDDFFSFRLEKGNTGRALGFIGRKIID